MSMTARSDTLSDAQELYNKLGLLHKEAERKGATADLLEQIIATQKATQVVIQDFAKPLRVGIVGAFSSGKTRLIEALLGCTGSLNVSEIPSTGNIVEFELDESEEGMAQLADYRVVLIDESRVATRLMHQFVQTAKGLVAAEANRLGDLQSALPSLEESPVRWSVAQKWASDVHAKCNGRGLKALAFEIYRLAYAIGQGRSYLGREFAITDKQAAELMSLKFDPTKMFELPLESLRGEFAAAPTAPDLRDLPLSKIEVLFPLVEKIRVKAKLPAGIREFFGKGAVRLVDCPGAGADGSNYRDGVLCAQELQNVDSVLVLLSARNPGQNREFLDALLRTWGEGAKDRIVAVVSRFDQLPYNKLELVDKNIDSSLTMKELLAAVPELRNVLEASLDTVMDRAYDRIAFTSTMGFLSYCLDKDLKALRGTVGFYNKEMKFDPETQDDSFINDIVLGHPWVKEMQFWERVGQSLDPQSDAARSLAQILSEFANDGGFGRLQRALQTNLNKFGRRNLEQRLDRQLDELEQKSKAIEKAVEKIVPSISKPADTKQRTATGELQALVSELKRAFQKIKKEQAMTSGIKLMRFKGAEVSELRPVIENNFIYQLSKWPQWRRLLDRILPDGTVKLVDPNNPELSKFPSRLKNEQETPVKSSDFFEPFCETVSWCYDLLKRHKTDSDAYFRADFARRCITDQLGGRANVSHAKEVLGAEREHWLTFANRRAEDTQGSLPKEQIASFFPLHLDSDFYFPWHKPLDESFGKQFGARKRHLMYVIRIRQTLIDAALLWLDDALARIEQELADHIREDMDGILEELQAVGEFERAVPAGSAQDDLLD